MSGVTFHVKLLNYGPTLWFLRVHFKSLFCEEEWRRQFLEIDPEHHGRVTAFFIERRLLQLRRMGLKRAQLAADDPVADALLGKVAFINDVTQIGVDFMT